jgi:crotonobetainyl-CoA:carnitine CoA-transferase CaiB-like acyl-CoA transferase
VSARNNFLHGFRALQIGPGLAAAVCGRALGDFGAEIHRLDTDDGSPLSAYLNHDAQTAPQRLTSDHLAQEAAKAHMIICEGSPDIVAERGLNEDKLRALNPGVTLVYISPYGQTGPWANRPATDLTLFAASGVSRLLTGQVDDISEAPTRPVGEQSAFIGGLAAACAGMHAALQAPDMDGHGATIDISLHEALALLAVGELTRAGQSGKVWSRKRVADGNGATVCILPASDGYVAISPREDKQWAAWLVAMDSPDWSTEARFKTKPDRVENWDALHALMSHWSRQHTKQTIADAAQAAHVPSFPLRELGEQFESPQLDHRDFFHALTIEGREVKTLGPAYNATPTGAATRSAPFGAGPLPLSGLRVLDFSWVIAGPTTTRHLAAMGADIIKVEAPGRGDPARGSELHMILGQAKRAIVLNLKQPAAVDIARRLAVECDVLVENFGTGVMDRLGLGADDLCAANPNLLYLSASGLGRTGPESHAVAYGTLLQCYAGFAGLNGQPDAAPRVGFAWLDPMSGLKIPFAIAAWAWRRTHGGGGARVDYSMIEALLWTMAEPILAAQLEEPPKPEGNASIRQAPHGIYPAKGEDAWVALAINDDAQWRALCAIIPTLATMTSWDEAARRKNSHDIDSKIAEWSQSRDATATTETLTNAGIPASPVATALDLINSAHLRDRAFWREWENGVLPELPWKASFGHRTGPAPELGADTDSVMAEILSLSESEISKLRASGAFG